MTDTSSVSLAADTFPSRGRQGAVLTCENCEFVRDEPWAGKREICHRCMAPGECQGYAVGFDSIWTSPAPAWCGKRRGGASGLDGPPRFESRGELHPGAMDAPMVQTRAAASDRWAALAEQLRGHLSVSGGAADSSP